MSTPAVPSPRAELHALVDSLPEGALVEARRRLVELHDDPLLRAWLAAPEDTEPLDVEDLVALEEAREERARGETIPWEAASSARGGR